MVDFGPDILDTEVLEVEPLDVNISSEPQHELMMALSSGVTKSSSPVIFDFSLQSRVEVILNAIINDLVYGEHPKSRVEQILLYILGEESTLPTPHSRVEELLVDLALELESTDISPKSRVEQILLVLLNQPYEFPITHSRVEELLVQLQKSVAEVTGPLPLTINTDGTALIDYRIYGNTEQTGTPTPENPIMPEGVGERTENVMPAGEKKTVEVNGITVSSDGNGKYTINGTAAANASARFNLLQAFTTPISVSNGGQGTLSFFNTQSNIKVGFIFCNGATNVDEWKQYQIRRTSTSYNVIGNKYIDSVEITVESGETVDMTITPEFTDDGILPSIYEPYGYKLPMVSRGENLLIETPIYIGETKLVKDEYVSYSEQKMYKRTENLAPPLSEWESGQIGNNGSWYPPGRAGFILSPFISCTLAESLVFSCIGGFPTYPYGGADRSIAFYDENQVFISLVGGYVDDPLAIEATPENAYFCRLQFAASGGRTHQVMLTKGTSVPEEYIPYGLAPQDPPVPLPALPTTEGETTFEYAGGEPQPEKMYVKYNKS